MSVSEAVVADFCAAIMSCVANAAEYAVFALEFASNGTTVF
jgi:hypothetical protein